MVDDATRNTEPGQQSDDEGRSPGALVGIVVVVLMAVLAGAVVFALTRDDDDDQVVSGTDPTTSSTTSTTAPTTMVPTDPEPVEPFEPGPQGTDSALVGMTELAVRELYPLVRVAEVDGEALPTTMDLLVGRINLSLEDGTVVSATTEGCEEVTGGSPSWVRQSCAPDPAEDGPDSFGKVIAGDSPGSLTLEVGFNGDDYYQGMVVRPTSGDEPAVRGTDGSVLSLDELGPNDVVWVWVDGACQESSPVQCDLAAVVVDRPPTS
jgi:hypothetical protein